MGDNAKVDNYITKKVNPIFERLIVDLLTEKPEKVVRNNKKNQQYNLKN